MTAALKLAPDNLTARLGHGWVLQQSGDTQGAIKEYRRVVEQAWPSEQKIKALMPSQRLFTHEAAGYLIPLLDKNRDAAEIATCARSSRTSTRRPRAITPVAIPLTDAPARPRHRGSAGAGPLRRGRLGTARLDVDHARCRLARLRRGRPRQHHVGPAVVRRRDVLAVLVERLRADARARRQRGRRAVWRGAEAPRDLARRAIATASRSAGEVRPLASHGIVALSCDYVGGDGARFAAISPRGARFADGDHQADLRRDPASLGIGRDELEAAQGSGLKAQAKRLELVTRRSCLSPEP